MESISSIRDRIRNTQTQELAQLIAGYEADPRDGVQKLLGSAEKRIEALHKELERTEKMKLYEHHGDKIRLTIQCQASLLQSSSHTFSSAHRKFY